MVILVVKRNELSFRIETRLEESVDDVIKLISDISNFLIRLQRILDLFPDLVKYGPLRPEEYRGLTSEEVIDGKVIEREILQCAPHNPNYVYSPDPSGYRCGKAALPCLQEKMNIFVDEVKNFLSKTSLAKRIITLGDLDKFLSTFKGFVNITYPDGLPPYDQLHGMLFEGVIDTTSSVKDLVDGSTCMLWFSSKKIERGQTLQYYFPKTRCYSEKSTLNVQITNPTTHPPAYEPQMWEENQKALMAYAFKKKKEDEKAEKVDDDSYLNSQWANPNSLKNKLSGLGGGISFK